MIDEAEGMKKLFEKTVRYLEGPMACVLRRDCRMRERDGRWIARWLAIGMHV